MSIVFQFNLSNTDKIGIKYNCLKIHEDQINNNTIQFYQIKNYKEIWPNKIYSSIISDIYIKKYDKVSFSINKHNVEKTEWPCVLSSTVQNINNINNYKDISILPLITFGSYHFGHFLQDCLPSLCFLKNFLNENPHITLLFWKPNFNLQELLDIFGIKNKILFTNIPNINCNCKELYYVHYTPNSTCMIWPPVFYKSINNILNKNLLQNVFLYISRNDAKQRKIFNENEVIRYLENKAKILNLIFVNFNHKNYSRLEETFDIFNRAKIIVAQYGQANLRTIACQKNTTFIEICCKMFCNIPIACSLELNYWILQINVSHTCTDINLDIKQLDEVLTESLKN